LNNFVPIIGHIPPALIISHAENYIRKVGFIVTGLLATIHAETKNHAEQKKSNFFHNGRFRHGSGYYTNET
jgi:hypothetical protein